MRKIIGILLSCVVFFSSTYCFAETKKNDDYLYEIKGKIIRIVKYIGKETETLTIPDTIDGKSVGIIGSESFRNTTPNKIVLPDSITTIESNGFSGSAAKEIIIPETNGKLTICGQAFGICDKLETIHFPSSVEFKGTVFFQGSWNLVSITIDKNHKTYEMLGDYIITKKDKGLFAYPPGLIGETLEIPDGIKSIPNEAFKGADNAKIKTLIIPDSVEKIGDSAFESLFGLTSLEIGSGVKKMGRGAFEYCQALKTVIIYDGTTVIGDYAFAGCRSLETIQIPDSVKSLGKNIFEEAYSVTIIASSKGAAAKYAQKNGLYVIEALQE